MQISFACPWAAHGRLPWNVQNSGQRVGSSGEQWAVSSFAWKIDHGHGQPMGSPLCCPWAAHGQQSGQLYVFFDWGHFCDISFIANFNINNVTYYNVKLYNACCTGATLAGYISPIRDGLRVWVGYSNWLYMCVFYTKTIRNINCMV